MLIPKRYIKKVYFNILMGFWGKLVEISISDRREKDPEKTVWNSEDKQPPF